jgi:endonuclease G, mitochondrial
VAAVRQAAARLQHRAARLEMSGSAGGIRARQCARGQAACYRLHGPVLDDQHDFPWERKKTEMKGFKAPRKFWKLVVRVDQGKLHATSLVADQSPLIDFKLPEALEPGGEELKHFAFDKVKKFQTSIAKLETLTGLDFGAHVRAADTFVPDAGGGNEKRVVNVEELSIALPAKGRKRAAARPARR